MDAALLRRAVAQSQREWMLRTAMNEGDVERSRGSARFCEWESSSELAATGAQREEGDANRIRSTTAEMETSNGGSGVRYMTDATRMQLAGGRWRDVRAEDGRRCGLDDGWDRRACAGD